MQNLQDLHLFDDNQSFQKQKEESINELMNDVDIMKVLSNGQVGRNFVEENWVEFLDFQEDMQKCKNCMGLQQCHKVSKGMKQVVHVENQSLKTILVPCKYGKEILEKQNILSHITVSNVSDELLLSDLKSIKDIMNKELASVIDRFLSNVSQNGLFICGPSGCGKSTLAGFLTRSLAKQGYRLGYVHFPTYLIDLKNSFNEFGNDNNIEELRNVDYLVIDDLGGENVTSWSRDEVLSAVLTYRSQNKKVTLFTSQYSKDDLIKIYTLKKDAREKIKVERLLNTIFTMSVPIMIKQ